jgi:very-short-patch-repair endonuclease
MIHRDQLLELGFSRHAIAHRVARGRLYPKWPNVYAVGRTKVSRRGMWRGALLACGTDAALSHDTSMAFWEIRPEEPNDLIHLSVPPGRVVRLEGIRAHRRTNLRRDEIVVVDGIAVTSPATTLIDMAPRLTPVQLERAVNAADKLEVIDPEGLRAALDKSPRRPGLAILRRLLDRPTFVLTDSELERMFLPIARRAGLGKPQTGVWLNGFKVDFYWLEPGLVVETDGLRYHRTPAEQARDRLRDQAQAAAGLVPLRFTHGQIRYEPTQVENTLRAVRARIATSSVRSGRP